MLGSKDIEEAIRLTKDAKPLHEVPLTSVWPILGYLMPWFKCKAKDEEQDELKISLVEEDSADDDEVVNVEAYKENPFKVIKN